MAKNLLIVESPAKAKTIEAILGKDFEVKSCYGHIRDLQKNDMGIDLNNNFKPTYIVPAEKEKVVRELKAIAKSSGEVWLASDEDREGESISWHLAEVLKLDPKTTKRIVFHEITKPAIEKAVKNPRTINMDLVDAQQARRVLDRIVGFELSPVLWRKIGQQGGLSAGRVQSVAVKLIVEKEREINNFKATASFKVEAYLNAEDLNNKKVSFKAEGQRYQQADDAQKFLESSIGATYKVTDVQKRPAKKTPAAPFTTSTLQQEASRKLGYGVSKTMLLAQKLYESGKITYMRTDSVNLSDTALDATKNEIIKSYGDKYVQPRKFKNKSESAQEAHEAIRPTYMENHSVGDMELNKLYELIWKRTIASQMSDAELEKTTVKIDILKTYSSTAIANDRELTATGEVIKFDGFLKVYMESNDDEDNDNFGGEGESRLPNLSVGQNLGFEKMTATEKFTRHAARYTEASLVKKMEELGIGRPSTYAPTISTIVKRNYVEKKDREGIKREYTMFTLENNQVHKKLLFENTGAEKSKLFPTDLGLVVTDFLSQHFTKVMDYSFTANIEKKFDEIAAGKMVWNNMVSEFYKPFHEGVQHTLDTAERAVGERTLGKDPETSKPVIARMGRYGPMVQLGSSEDEEKPRYAKLKANQSIETITFDEAMELFKLPLTLGDYEGQELSINIGRFGPYIKMNDQFISIPRGEDLGEVDLERAIEIIKAKQIEDAPIGFYDEKPITKGKGRFGPFIKWNDLYINVPKAYDFDNISQADCNELIIKKIDKEANRFIQQWPDQNISIENGRWGPFIRFKKKMLKLSAKKDGEKYTPEELAEIDLESVKKMIIEREPNAFAKAAAKKSPAKKSAAKKTVTKKPISKK
ncbi:MAG: type I DNA topoisomerase [Ferruginibacter sp.]